MQSIDMPIYSSSAVPEAAFTAATTDIITSNAHGLSEGDLLQLTTTTTLPAGLSLTTNYYVINPTTNTFQLSATRGGTAVNITDTGTGTHTYHLKGKTVYTGDYDVLNLDVDMSGTPTMTIKVQGSDSSAAPDFNAAQSATNRWDYLDIIRDDTAASIDGTTGVASTGSNVHNSFSINVDRKQWVSIVISAFTAGKLGVFLTGYSTRN